MINEKKFINDYNSFWSGLLPTMTQFVARLNKRTTKYQKPISLLSDQDTRGLTNETAFNISVARNEALIKGQHFNVDKHVYQLAKRKAWSKIINFEMEELDETEMPSISEHEVRALFESLEFFLDRYRRDNIPVIFNPRFKGCGFLDQCEGDLLVGNTLFEIKAGNRNFRGPDIRQLLVYYSLNFFESNSQYEKFGLINPRTGKYIIYNVDEISYLLSGKTGLDLANEILFFLLGYEISK